MTTVRSIAGYFEEKLPSVFKSEFDNVGLLVGMNDAPVKKALVALEITDEVIAEAASAGAELIVSHHPLFFDLKAVNDETVTGRRIVKLIQNGISALCMHTNFDRLAGGVNDILASSLGVAPQGHLGAEITAPDGSACGMGRFGTLGSEMSFSDFLSHVKTALGADGLRYYDAGLPVFKVGVLGGSGGSFIEAAISAGCDTFVTSDIKHAEFLTARARGINLIDGGHYFTENLAVPQLARLLKDGFPEIDVRISEAASVPMTFYMS